jgi:hypothetical protein
MGYPTRDEPRQEAIGLPAREDQPSHGTAGRDAGATGVWEALELTHPARPEIGCRRLGGLRGLSG